MLPPAGAMRARSRGESCILECPVPRNVLLDPFVDLIALTVTSAWMLCARTGRLACAPRPPRPRRRPSCVLCLDVLCSVYVRPPRSSLDVLFWMLLLEAAQRHARLEGTPSCSAHAFQATWGSFLSRMCLKPRAAHWPSLRLC